MKNLLKSGFSKISNTKYLLPGLIFGVGGIAIGAGASVLSLNFQSAQAPREFPTDSPAKETTPEVTLDTTEPVVAKKIFGITLGESRQKSEVQIHNTNATDAVTESDANSTPWIENVEIKVSGAYATVTWTTAAVARSQLILDNGNGKGYESLNGIGKIHEVELVGLTPSADYDFKIVSSASSNNLSDSYYGSIEAKKVYVAYVSTYEDSESCRPLVIEDTAGNPARDLRFEISGTYYSAGGTNFILPRTFVETDAYGLVRDWPGCKSAVSASIKFR